jgi:hypothetical protein
MKQMKVDWAKGQQSLYLSGLYSFTGEAWEGDYYQFTTAHNMYPCPKGTLRLRTKLEGSKPVVDFRIV